MRFTTLRHFNPLPLRVHHESIDASEVKAALRAHPGAELTEQLSRFGDLMLGEVISRSSVLETKALSVLGWAAALLAFLLLGGGTWQDRAWWQKGGLMLSIVAALVSVAFSFDALRVCKWTWPSQRDWFRCDLFGDVERLRRYHLLALLENHETHSLENGRKATSLEHAQWGLIIAVILGTLTVVATSLLP